MGPEFGRKLGMLRNGWHWAYTGPGRAEMLRCVEKRQGSYTESNGDSALGLLDKDRLCGSLWLPSSQPVLPSVAALGLSRSWPGLASYGRAGWLQWACLRATGAWCLAWLLCVAVVRG